MRSLGELLTIWINYFILITDQELESCPKLNYNNHLSIINQGPLWRLEHLNDLYDCLVLSTFEYNFLKVLFIKFDGDLSELFINFLSLECSCMFSEKKNKMYK